MKLCLIGFGFLVACGGAESSTKGTCHACTGSNCQANGCFGGWYCKLDTQKCVAKPDGC